MCFPIALSLHLKYQLQTLDEKSLIGRYKHDLINFHGFRALVRGPCMTLTNYKNAQSMEYKARRKRESKNAKKCETRNKTVFHTRLRHPEMINSVPLNSVLRIKQTGV